MTAYEQYALDAFGVDAIGYVLKPYSKQEVHKEIKKAARFRPVSRKYVRIQTIPDFVVWVDGEKISLGRPKAEEMLALLVDRGSAGITAGEAITYLWPDRAADENTRSLCRMTYKRMLDALKVIGIDDIIASEGRKKYILQEKVDCDLYHILSGDRAAAHTYCGEYMREYSWAETTNAQILKLCRREIEH